MDEYTASEKAQEWGISERSVRNYCQAGRIEGAYLSGKTWRIPRDAAKPKRKNALRPTSLLDILREEKCCRRKGSIYHRLQLDLTYNSNHMEGSRLSHDETRYIYETNTIGLGAKSHRVDDIIETVNHFRCIDAVIAQAHKPLSERVIKQLHAILKSGTSDANKDSFAVGAYKNLPNEVGGQETTLPEDVSPAMKALLARYHGTQTKTLEDLISFHHEFESIHPFQDGNGRVGRLILLKECLKYNIVPFVIDEELKMFYYRGLQEYPRIQEYLLDTCLTAQDKFKRILDYFRISY
ncbi:MAG: Fic family protein [Akkermansia sp.]